jgi:hypothetical protein
MITTIVCNDVDDGLNSNLIYTIVGGNTGTAFRLDGTTIEVNSALDYETVSQYVLVVEAKDQGLSSVPTTLISPECSSIKNLPSPFPV